MNCSRISCLHDVFVFTRLCATPKKCFYFLTFFFFKPIDNLRRCNFVLYQESGLGRRNLSHPQPAPLHQVLKYSLNLPTIQLSGCFWCPPLLNAASRVFSVGMFQEVLKNSPTQVGFIFR